MKKLSHFVLAALTLTTASAASAQSLTETQARAVIAPWYSLFNVASRGDVKAIQERVLAADSVLRRVSTGGMLGPRHVD